MSATPPGKRSFFKYVSPDTALAVLRTKTIRYSSPLMFNDPFDFQSGLHFDFDIGSLHSRVLDKLQELTCSTEEPSIDREDPWGKLVLLARTNYQTHGFPRERWEKLIAPPFAQLVAEIKITQQKYQDQWWKVLLPGIRVFCVSEDRDNLLMWAHYAKDHTGVVFEFLSLPNEDNPLSVAQPVTYLDYPAPFFTATEWIEDILSIKRLNEHDLYKRYAYIKSNHWRYEREWRVWYPLTPSLDTMYEDLPIRPTELAAIYIGCRAEPNFVEQIISLTRSAFPHTTIHRARKSEEEYALEYIEI